MDRQTMASPAPPKSPPTGPPQRASDLEDQADEFEDELAAEMIRTGAIEQW